MQWRLGSITVLSMVIFVSISMAGTVSDVEAQLRLRHAGARLHYDGARVTRVYGIALERGPSPEQNADRFVQANAPAFGVIADELRPGNAFNGQRTQPVMYEAATGTYKFTLVYYSQFKHGFRVFGADLRLLARNEPGFPVVWVGSSLRGLGDFAVPRHIQSAAAEKAAHAAAIRFRPALTDFSQAEQVVWAGVDDSAATPRLALTFTGQGVARDGLENKWRFVTDAETGEILHSEDLIIFTDVTGNVSGLATQGAKADYCAAEITKPMPWAGVTLVGGDTVYTDVDGNYSIDHDGTAVVTVQSGMAGLYFIVDNAAGDEDVITVVDVPPGNVDFLHNADNDEEFVRSQTNAYVQSNIIRDKLLAQNAEYPTISTETSFPVNVNLTGGYCPGNAWYVGGSSPSMNFCAAGSVYSNTAFQSVIAHEYGHHAVAMGGSGQQAYGEGMGDCFSVLLADHPVVGRGYSGICSAGLRTADNDLQYPCFGEIHQCGQLLSGCVWSTRCNLVATEPQQYLDILWNLTVNSILLHDGWSITPQISIDFLILDDDNGDLSDLTPHYTEITEGFAAHNMWGEHPESLSFLAQWSGQCQNLALSGDTAYLATGLSLVIADVSDPAAPEFLGQVTLPDLVAGIAVVGDYAYVTDYYAGLQIVDVSDPAAPIIVGVYEADAPVTDVVVCGGYAYVASTGGLLEVVDVSDPAAPVRAGGCNTIGAAFRLALVGDLLYVAEPGTNGGLQIIDVSVPSAPNSVGYQYVNGGLLDVAVSGNYAYAAGQFSGLDIIDVSNPAALVHVSWCDTTFAWGVSLLGDYALLADVGGGLRVVDITDPNAPFVAGSYPTTGTTYDVIGSGNYAYVADNTGGLQIIDVTTPTAPALEGTGPYAGSAQAIALADGYAYVANQFGGLQIADVSNPARSHWVGACATPGNASGVAVSGDFAYLASGLEGLRVIDVSNPAAPLARGYWNTSGWAWNVVAVGSLAYVVDDTDGLVILDVSDANSPVWLGQCSSDGAATAIAVRGNYAYIAADFGGLEIVDISDPCDPVQVGVCNTNGYAWGVAVVDDYAYVADAEAGLKIIDVSDPNQPFLAGSCTLLGAAYSVTVSGHYAYVSGYGFGVEVVDVSDPYSPRWATENRLALYPWAIAIDGYLFVAAEFTGVVVLRDGQVGDMNCDGVLDLGDITPFTSRLIEPATYFATYPDCPIMNGDINGDGEVDQADVNPFITLLSEP